MGAKPFQRCRSVWSANALRDNRSAGRSGEIRTPDPLLPKQVRYQAALRSARPIRRRNNARNLSRGRWFIRLTCRSYRRKRGFSARRIVCEPLGAQAAVPIRRCRLIRDRLSKRSHLKQQRARLSA
jgi:hypothetical protein